MKRSPVASEDLRGVFPVPPLAPNPAENDRLISHLKSGGITRFLYGGNAFLYHIPLREYEALLEWLTGIDGWVIPSAGPSYGRLMDQAPLLKSHRFPCVMALPCSDPRDARGLETGLRRFADAAQTLLMVYLKEESNFGADKLGGLDAVARLVADGVCVAIKYAVVRKDPTEDGYLRALLDRVPAQVVISGIGERPAIVHMRDWGLPGFTTGSGCVNPALSQRLFELLSARKYDLAESVRAKFIPLEDLRDAWGPARVLHAAVELTGIARVGEIAPFVSGLSEEQKRELRPAAEGLLKAESPLSQRA
jgi:dihydrodipicolinate synthase/N-acetylneuraminate lyase